MNLTNTIQAVSRRGIRRSLLFWSLLLFGLALGLNTITSSVYMRRQISQSTGVMQKEVASLTARHVQAYIAQKTLRLRDAATNLSLHQLGSREQRIIVSLLVKNDESFEEISVLDNQGQERLRVSDRKVYFDLDLRDLSKNPAFETAVKGKDYVSPVYTSDKDEPYIFIAVPLTNPTKSTVEVALARTSMRFLWELVRQETFGRAGIIYLVNDKGRLIAHKDPLRVLDNPNLENLPAVATFLGSRNKNEMPAIRGAGLSGKDVLSTFAPVAGLGWAVIVEEPVEFALADIKALEQFTRILLVGGLLVGFVLILVLSNRVTRPIVKLREGAMTIREGNLDYRVAIDSKDEIGELAVQFNQMADTIKTSQDLLETRVEQRTRELSLLYGVTTHVNESLDLSSLLNYGIEKIRDFFHFDAIWIYVFDDDAQTLTLSASFSSKEILPRAVGPFRRGESLIGRVVESNEPVVFENIQTDSQYAILSQSKLAQTEGYQFLAAIPLKTQRQTLGVAMFSSSQAQKLGDDKTKLLNAICEQIALAVEKSRLFKEITKRSEALENANAELTREIVQRERAQQEVSRQHRRIEVLHEVSAALNSTLDRRVLIDLLLTKIEELLPYEAMTLRLVNKLTGQLESVASKNLEDEDYSQIPNGGMSRMVFERKQFLIVEDLQTDSRVLMPEFWRKHNLITYIGIPLIAEDETVGVMGFYLNHKHTFAKEETEFLSTLAGQIAIAINNSELYERTKQQAADLEEANRAKDEFLNVMSHELRTPLNVVSGYAQVLDEGVLGDITVEQKHAVQTILFQSRELLRMINEILQVGSLQAGKVRFVLEDTNLNDLFDELKRTCDVLSKKAVTLHWHIPPELPIIRTDGDKIKHVLQNLIHNALKFTEEGSVTVSARCLASVVEFKVKDTGVGISKEMLPVIFEMFRQVDSSKTRSYGGAGVGLFIVKRFIELLSGKISVDSTPGEGTTFSVTIPAFRSAPSTERSDDDFRSDAAL